MIYLASPYCHPDAEIREQRFQAACRAAARMIRNGRAVFSPVAHAHPIAHYGLPTVWDYCADIDERLLVACDEVMVLYIDGWEESEGVQAELGLARQLGKRVRFLRIERSDGSAPFGREGKNR